MKLVGRERVNTIVNLVCLGVRAESPELLKDDYFSSGIAAAFKALNLAPNPHSMTIDDMWLWCRSQSPHDYLRILAGLGFLGNACGGGTDYLSCEGCSVYKYCPSRFAPNNRAEECGE